MYFFDNPCIKLANRNQNPYIKLADRNRNNNLSVYGLYNHSLPNIQNLKKKKIQTQNRISTCIISLSRNAKKKRFKNKKEV